jgi:hypothetical protein
VEATDTLNILPLAEEIAPKGAGDFFFIRRGIDIKYVTYQHSLTFVVHFSRISGITKLMSH